MACTHHGVDRVCVLMLGLRAPHLASAWLATCASWCVTGSIDKLQTNNNEAASKQACRALCYYVFVDVCGIQYQYSHQHACTMHTHASTHHHTCILQAHAGAPISCRAPFPLHTAGNPTIVTTVDICMCVHWTAVVKEAGQLDGL